MNFCKDLSEIHLQGFNVGALIECVLVVAVFVKKNVRLFKWHVSSIGEIILRWKEYDQEGIQTIYKILLRQNKCSKLRFELFEIKKKLDPQINIITRWSYKQCKKEQRILLLSSNSF